MGGTRFRDTKLFKNLNNKNYKQAAEEFKDINKSAGDKQGGLTTRRLKENEIFLKDIQ